MVKTPVISSAFDPARFAHLSEAEVLQRIGALLAKAVLRSGFLRRGPVHSRQATEKVVPVTPTVDVLELTADSVERQLVQFLQYAGPTAPGDLAATLGIPRRTVARKLRRLRALGLCEVVGHTRAAQYRLRVDHGRN